VIPEIIPHINVDAVNITIFEGDPDQGGTYAFGDRKTGMKVIAIVTVEIFIHNQAAVSDYHQAVNIAIFAVINHTQKF
jgi:hypothetical protein